MDEVGQWEKTLYNNILGVFPLSGMVRIIAALCLGPFLVLRHL
jgi:hypothetical protein